uniref:Cytochrome P450 3A21 n=1 Tax=Anthurium amnicola TaxID=1678845 RepID=A0A1D1YAW8_9ARAE
MLDLTSLANFLVLGVIGWITYKIYIWPFYISPLRKIPGPPSDSPFYGNIKALITEQPDNQEPQLQWVNKYGTIVKYNGLFNKPTLFITDQKIIQEMTSSRTYDFIKPFRPGALAFIGNGLVLAEGDDHKRQKKMMSPAFFHSNIKEMIPTFIHVTSTLKGLIENEVKLGKPDINFTPLITKTTLDIIGLVGFSYEFNSLTSSNELAEAYNSVLNRPISTLRITITLLGSYIPILRELPIEANKRFKNSCAIITRVSKKLVEEKSKKAENGELKEKDLISLLININKTLPAEEKMTNEELKSQVIKKKLIITYFIYLFVYLFISFSGEYFRL